MELITTLSWHLGPHCDSQLKMKKKTEILQLTGSFMYNYSDLPPEAELQTLYSLPPTLFSTIEENRHLRTSQIKRL